MSEAPSSNSGLNPSTAELIAWDRQYLWHPFTPMKPWIENKNIVVIERGEREFLFDTLGRRYIDAVSSLWCNIHGHCVPELDEAVRQQLSKIAHTTLLGLSNVPAILLAKRLIDLVHSRHIALDKVFYSDNGSTAVEVACKMAYQYWQNVEPTETSFVQAHGMESLGLRTRFIAFDAAYHGDTLGAVSLGGVPLFHHVFKQLCFPVDFAPIPQATDGGFTSMAHVESLLRENPRVYAGIVVEPLVLGAGGMHMYGPSVLCELRRLADKYHTLLIFDEVLTGFGRTGKMFATEHTASGDTPARARPVTPDFLCLSKGLTAGYMPLGATLTTQKIFDGFYVDPNAKGGVNLHKTFFHGHTFTGNPLACSVALASLDLFDKTHLLEHVASLEPVLADCLAQAAQRSPFVHNPRRWGLIGAFDLTHPDGSAFPAHWRVAGELCTRMRALGIMLRPLADTIVIMPPLAITAENMGVLCAGIVRSLQWIPEIIAERERTEANELLH